VSERGFTSNVKKLYMAEKSTEKRKIKDENRTVKGRQNRKVRRKT